MRTKRDVNQIVKAEHDELTNSKKVRIVETQFNMELDADDGDSVSVQRRVKELNMKDGDIAEVVNYKEFVVQTSGCNIEGSIDGETYNLLHTFNGPITIPTLIFTKYIRVTGGNAVILVRG